MNSKLMAESTKGKVNELEYPSDLHFCVYTCQRMYLLNV